MIAYLCDEHGQETLGSDGALYIDNRCKPRTTDAIVANYREHFRKNFPRKYETWTHYKVYGVVREIP